MSGMTNMCLDVENFTGPKVEMWTCNGGTNQKWTVVGDGTITCSGKCLTASDGSDQPTEVWAAPLSGGATAVLLFNRKPSTQTIVAYWSDVGATGNQVVRDLWLHKDMGTFATSYTATVNPHAVAFLKLTPA
eukprot:TRINITY_DN446_c0_g1_i1.p2 TRINITY_DN446_c0_g1~~TRINITY_DN446_c0_g1_i1.p2  ORF type:complete len:132 (-),score=50.87 TRINITY_DN446_c0_g1_i1:130-525(-)